MRLRSHELTPVRRTGLLAGLIAFAFLEWAELGLSREARHASAASALMIVWWFTEAIPIHWTGLVPLFLFPALVVFPKRDPGLWGQLGPVAEAYLDPNTFLFLGGMGIGAAMERWNLHRRVALTILGAVGGGPGRIVLGFVAATAFISLWISNTATAVMMVPIGVAVIRRLEEERGRRLERLGLAIMLSIAYAANVGGIGTKIGTGPNAIFAQSAAKAGRDVGFLDFMTIGLPFVVLFLPMVWFVLARQARRELGIGESSREGFRKQLRDLGPLSLPEKWILAVFGATALCWIFGKPLSESLHFSSSTPFDAWVAMGASGLLALVPLGGGRRALDLQATRRIPFSVLLLLGGSFAMAAGIDASGLVAVLGEHLGALSSWPPLLAFLSVAALSVGLSAVASNTATTTLMMGVLRGAFPGDLAVPVMGTAAIAASCDFMLPAGTPPNAVVFGSGYVRIQQMIRIGAVLDLSAAFLAGLWGWFGIRQIL